jgi:NosR/NirI family transcriptional regulator, nitrous oxide reductase regulator
VPRPETRARRLRTATLLAVAAILAAAAGPARAGSLSRADLARWFPDPYVVGEKEKDVPVWPLFKNSGPPSHRLDLAGYAFESADLAPVPGFAGTPVDLLVALGPDGEFLEVALLSQHEPVFVGGVGEEPLVRYLAQYRGLSLKQNITAGGGGARTSHAGSTNVYLDGVAKATASLRIINQSVLSSALKVARAKLGYSGASDPDLVAHVRTDLFEPRTWRQLVDAGLVRHLALTNGDVEKGFAGTEGAGLDPEARARPDAPFCDVWAALATVPMAGRNLLTGAAWQTLVNRTQVGDHVLAVMARGRCRLVSDTFQRNTVPDRLSLRQSGLPIEMRDLDIDAPLRDAGQPELDQAMTFRVIFQAGLDPGRPMQLLLRVTRSRGTIYPDQFVHDFALEVAVPSDFVVPAADDQKTWVATWKARRVEIAVLLGALALLSFALGRPSRLVARARPLRWFRPAFLVFTLGFVGWFAQGQLSIVNVVALLQAALAWRSFGFYLYDPMTAILSAFVVVTAFVWGRGTFCGWLCPFGALQELVAIGTGRLGLRPRRVDPALDRRLKRVKYGVLAVILAAAVVSVRWADRLVEIEPFKTAITLRFERTWGFTAYAVALVVLGAVFYKAFCRWLCPLGAFLALAGRLRRFDWIARRVECGSPCQLCRNRCEYQAIERDGSIVYEECFQCMDCVAVYNDDDLCVPRILERKGRSLPVVRDGARRTGARGGSRASGPGRRS